LGILRVRMGLEIVLELEWQEIFLRKSGPDWGQMRRIGFKD
jgi:hypothetical protein